MLSEDELRRAPEDEDKWRYEEPESPRWEHFITSDMLKGMVGSEEQFTYLVIDMKAQPKMYVSSTEFVDLEEMQ